MFSEQELRAMPLKQLHDLKRGWLAVGQVAFANGAQWQAVFTKDGKGSGPPNAQGKCGVLKEDYIADLLAAIRSYSELMQECELALTIVGAHDKAAGLAADEAEDAAADEAADEAADPAADEAAEPAPGPAAEPAPTPAPAAAPDIAPVASDRSRRITKPTQAYAYDPAKDGANDQARLGKAKPKKPPRRR